MRDQYTFNDGNAEARRRAVQTIHDALASVERTDPVGAARGRNALRELAPALPGRPAKLGVGGWNHQQVLARKVRGILSARHKDDPQSVTEVGDRILALASCRSRIRHQAAAGSWTMPRQWEIQRTWLNSARAAVRSPAKPNGV